MKKTTEQYFCDICKYEIRDKEEILDFKRKEQTYIYRLQIHFGGKEHYFTDHICLFCQNEIIEKIELLSDKTKSIYHGWNKLIDCTKD